MAMTKLRLLQSDYVKHLEYLCQSYMAPLNNGNIITKMQHQTLFMNIESIVKTSMNFMNALQSKQMRIWDHILKYCKNIHFEYSKYISLYSESKILHSQLCRSNAKFLNFIRAQNKVNKSSNDLSLLLQLPLTHIDEIRDQILQISKDSNVCRSEHNMSKECLHLMNDLCSKRRQLGNKRGIQENFFKYVRCIEEFVLNEEYKLSLLEEFLVTMNPQNNSLLFNMKIRSKQEWIMKVSAFKQFYSDFVSKLKCNLTNNNAQFAGIWKKFIDGFAAHFKLLIDDFNDIRSFLADVNSNLSLFGVQNICVQLADYAHHFKRMRQFIANNECSDYVQLTRAIHCIEQFEKENDRKLNEIRQTFNICLFRYKLDDASSSKPFDSDCAYLFDEHLMKISTFHQQNKIYLFVLFETCLMYCSLNNHNQENELLSLSDLNQRKYEKVSIHIHRKGLRLNDGATSIIDYDYPVNGSMTTFAIMTSTESFLVCAKNQESKRKWLTTLNEIIINNPIFDVKRPCTLFLPYSFTDRCMMEDCNLSFAKNNLKKMHCRSCGRIVCVKCCNYQIHSFEAPNNLIIACKDCSLYCGNNEEKDENVMIDKSNGHKQNNLSYKCVKRRLDIPNRNSKRLKSVVVDN